MGKLLQNIVHGIVPSWLTRVKSSQKMLPPPPTSTQSSPSNDLRRHDRSAQSSSNIEVATTPENSCSVDSETTPSMQHKDGKLNLTDNGENHSHKIHQLEDNNNCRHLHHADVDDCSHGIYIPAAQIYVPNQQKDEGIQDENRHCEHRYHRHNMGHPNCNHVLLASGKRSPCLRCKQEDDNSQHHKKDHGGYHEQQPNAKHDHSYVRLKREIGCAQEGQKNRHCDLLGFKRKSRYSEEGKDEEETRGSRGDGGKRRKREEGLISCELPESICGIVGNAKAVVKYSQEAQQAMWESMVEMIVGNGLWEWGSLEFLLFCYLSLNEPHLHSLIQSSFLQVLKDLERTF